MENEKLNSFIRIASDKLELDNSVNRFSFRIGRKICFSLPGSIFTLIKLYGSKKAFRLILSPQIRYQRNLKSYGGSVVLPLASNEGVVLISAKKKMVLKLVKGEVELRRIANELDAEFTFSRKLSICPKIIDHGSIGDDMYWIIQEIWPNSNPVTTDEIREFANRELAGPLLSAYNLAGIEVHELHEWINGIKTKASEKIHASNLFRPLINRIKNSTKYTSTQVYTTRFHGDFYLKHIHRNKNGWRIIDWGLFENGNAMEDWLSLELKTERKRWHELSLIKRLESAKTVEDISNSLLLDWPGPLLSEIFGNSICDVEVLRVLIYTTLAERLIRLEELVETDPDEIEWLNAALRGL